MVSAPALILVCQGLQCTRFEMTMELLIVLVVSVLSRFGEWI